MMWQKSLVGGILYKHDFLQVPPVDKYLILIKDIKELQP